MRTENDATKDHQERHLKDNHEYSRSRGDSWPRAQSDWHKPKPSGCDKAYCEGEHYCLSAELEFRAAKRGEEIDNEGGGKARRYQGTDHCDKVRLTHVDV